MQKKYIYSRRLPSGHNHQKSSLWECTFDNMTPYFEYRINTELTKTALLQTVFWRFCPPGICQFSSEYYREYRNREYRKYGICLSKSCYFFVLCYLFIQILISRNGVLQEENLPNTIVESFWIGPSLVSETMTFRHG